MFVILWFLFSVVDAVYFSMSDITVEIPAGSRELLGENVTLVKMYAQGDNSMKFRFVNKVKNLHIDENSGQVVFIRRNHTDLPATIKAEDRSGHDKTFFYVSKSSLTSCNHLENICFWQSVKYRIQENSPPTIIGSLASPYLAEICPGYKVNYKLNNQNGDFIIIDKPIYQIQSRTRLSRNNSPIVPLNISCIIQNHEGTREISRSFNISVLDIDDNPPISQNPEYIIKVKSNFVKKGETIRNNELIFHDKDSPEVNHYKVTILNDKYKILEPEPKCKKLPKTLPNNENSIQEITETAFACNEFTFIKNMNIPDFTYSVILQVNDTTLINGSKVVKVPIHIYFHNDSGYHPATVKAKPRDLLIYPEHEVRIFRTAAPLARLTQPIDSKLKDANNFKLKATISDLQDIFNVTYKGGIIFVHDPYKLSIAPENLSLNISWVRDGNKMEWDMIDVQIVIEPNESCKNMSQLPLHEWDWCANFDRRSKCLSADTCALSTGGSSSVDRSLVQGPKRCVWRGDKNPGDEVTTLYATCTPDIKTCPDRICDPLEALNDRICPQDCYKEIIFPALRNRETDRGIDKASGVCTCGETSCHCRKIPMKKNKENSNMKLENVTMNETILQPNVSRHIGNMTAHKILGIDMAQCGTTCVLGIIAAAVFLTGAAAMLVICWHLDRVHKAARVKFNDDVQDITMPLSDYVDRSAGDPLTLNFNMTTSLADTAILNIINKYAPDPKWEFPRNQLTIEQTLGEGEFGRVLRAKALNISGQTGYTTVAVKTLKDDAREAELNDLLSEYQLLKEVSHPNIIRLLGVCTAPGGPIYLIIEFAEHGSLRNYLRRSRHLKSETWRLPSATGLEDTPEVHYDEPQVSQITPKEILSFAWQICKGMAYLSEIKLVHRDLAARNVLLAADKVCKISDFGLTRDIYEDDAYFKRSKGRVPVKWMAPESLSDHVYTNKSDVWSFGILVWELVTLGATPYPGIAVQNLFHLLKQGYRMERPDNCSSTLYNIMRNCWHLEPEQRPSFPELSRLFEKMLSDQVDYLDLTNNSIHNRSYFCNPFDEHDANSDNIDKTKMEQSPPVVTVTETDKSEINPLNYLSKSESYVKCGAADKLQNGTLLLNEQDTNQNDINTTGYETPVKVAKKLQTPTNDCPQYYTDMAAGKIN